MKKHTDLLSDAPFAPSPEPTMKSEGAAMDRTTTNGQLQRKLSSFEVLLLTLSGLSPVFSIFGAGSDVLQHAGTGAAGLFVLAFGVAVIYAVIYAELGSAFPYAGGDYVGIGAILGGWAGVVVLALWAVASGPSIAFEARLVGVYVHEWVPGAPAAVVTFGALGVALVIALLAARVGALVTGVFLAVELAAVLVLSAGGLWHPLRGLHAAVAYPLAINASGAWSPVALGTLAVGAVSAACGTVGGAQAIYFGEELHDPHRRMGRVVLISGLIGAIAIIVPVVAVVLGAPNLREVLGSSAPLATFVSQIAGPWAARALSAAVALAIFNAMIAQVMTQSRLFFSLGRDAVLTGGLNRVLAKVDRVSGVPRAATLVVVALAAPCCFLADHTLLVFLAGLLVYVLALACVAVLVGRRKGLTGGAGYWRALMFPVAPVLGLTVCALFAFADWNDRDAGRPSLFILGALAVVAMAWCQLVLKRRPGGWSPKVSADANAC